ncbi:MAG: YdcF family protein [Acidobacteriota bacterium]
MKRRLMLSLGLLGLFAALVAGTGRFLVVDEPEKSDAILVLAGETYNRPMLALDLLERGYAPRIVMDVPAAERIYQWTAPELAQRWVQGLPQANSISICPIHGLSTRDESHEAENCMARAGGVHKVLIVTSDFHTRRARSVFQHETPGLEFNIAAAHNPAEFGVLWWRQREWAKTNLYEWMRLMWWELVDRWR